jgi:glycosyltransferase involved in cell wall biosynthesis
MRILWIPHTGWHIPQRAHLFCRALSTRHEVHVTDWVADFTVLRDYLSRRYLRNFFYRRYTDGAITVHGIPRISPALFIPQLRRLNTSVLTRIVQQIIVKQRIDVVVGTFLVPPPQAPRVVFDLFDDNVAYWRSFGRSADYVHEIEQIETAYIHRADAIVAVSSVLVDMVRQKHARNQIHLIPNGIDVHRYDNLDQAQARQKTGIAGRIVGVVGNHDKWPELEKILAVARLLADEDITFLIVGRGAAIPTARKQVRQAGLSNVVFQGYVHPDEAAHLVAALDVGLCPYQKTPGADAGSPMRLLMYAAAGLPTVCTALEEVRRMNFPNVVLVEDTAPSFAAGIRQALTLPRERPAQVAAYDMAHLVTQYEAVLQG